ncbi:hypothetical protein [Subtercola boreus]|uniref:hypothetical protein n=1 Tax=Subtercola boreus TaxID=120213 RepID=UPI0011C0713B|nr:hypothetical protein [Subtercola boreus]
MDISSDEFLDVGVERTAEIFRVRFWSVPVNDWTAATVEGWRIKNANVSEVLEWARANCRERTFELFIEWADQAQTMDGKLVPQVGLARLMGKRPQPDHSVTVSWVSPQPS